MSSPIPTLREYGEYLESLERPFNLDVLLVAEDLRSRTGPSASRDRFDHAADDLVLEPVGAGAMLVDLESARGARTGRRRWLIAVAAVVAAALLVAGTVAVTGGDHVRSGGPAAQTPSPQPVSALDGVFPPKGATPSTPETGEEVAAITFRRMAPGISKLGDYWINLYADGRLLRPNAAYDPGFLVGIAEQRLTPEGVELVRSAFLSTGLFDAGQTNSDVDLWCGCFARVRDDSGHLVVPADRDSPPTDAERAMVDPRIQSEVDRLVEFMTNLESSLPETAWADREIKMYVPSRYAASVWIEGPTNGSVRNLSKVLARVLPTRLVRHLDDLGWHQTASGDSVVLTMADARALHQALANARIGFKTYGEAALIYEPFPYRWRGRITDAHNIRISLAQLLPDVSS